MRREAEEALAVFDELDDDAGSHALRTSLGILSGLRERGRATGSGGAGDRAREAGRQPARRGLQCCAGFGWLMGGGRHLPAMARRRIEEVVLRGLRTVARGARGDVPRLSHGMEGRFEEARRTDAASGR